TSSWDGTAKIWDLSTGKELRTLVGHASTINTVVFSPDGTRLATASDDGTAKVWDADTAKLLLTLYGDSSSLNSVTFSPDGAWLAVGSRTLVRVYVLRIE